ncbi:MAG: 50S ribosomal protein L25 [Nitrospirota bacterium]|nr:50S ribosomal protein L25 [Nitrospirota bacterium]
MSANIVLDAEIRTETGKGVARRLRSAGRIPAVMYGAGEPVSLSLSSKEFTRAWERDGAAHGLIGLNITGGGKTEKKNVVLRDLQQDWVTGRIIHADLYETQKGHKLSVTVNIHLVGDSPIGVRESQGILQQMMHEVEIDCLPDAIPDALEIDASRLDVGDSLHVSDLTLPEGVHIHAAPDATVVAVSASRVAAADTETEAGGEGAAEGGEAAGE